MSLQDFLKNLQEQDDKDMTYSSKVSHNVKVIPPENAKIEQVTNNTKVIAPETEKPPQQNKLKLNLHVQVPVKLQEEKIVEKSIVKENEIKETKTEILETTNEEELFLKSGTDLEFKRQWLEVYEKSRNSKKQNAVAEKLRQGRFIYTKDAIIILPDYDVSNKSAEEMLEEKWI